jgi:hypothetical protein
VANEPDKKIAKEFVFPFSEGGYFFLCFMQVTSEEQQHSISNQLDFTSACCDTTARQRK